LCTSKRSTRPTPALRPRLLAPSGAAGTGPPSERERERERKIKTQTSPGIARMLPRCLLALPCISLLTIFRSSSAFVSAFAPGCIHISQGPSAIARMRFCGQLPGPSSVGLRCAPDGAGFKTSVACNELRFGAGSVTKMKMSGKEFEDYGSKRASFEPRYTRAPFLSRES
jgi:hypothetical protein